jgi:hypothetical protein
MFGNALLLWLGYYWLGVGEASIPKLAWSFLTVSLLVCGAVWLHGAAFVHFQAAERPGVASPLLQSLRNLAPLVAVGIGALALYFLLWHWEKASALEARQLASYLTMKFRRPVKPAAVGLVFQSGFWLLRWVILPWVLLPLVSGVASRGWHGFGEIGPRGRTWLWRVAAPSLLLCALWAPLKLIRWTPWMGGFGFEAFSFLVRLGAAYLLFVGGSLLLAFLTSRGRPSLSQLSTVSSP